MSDLRDAKKQELAESRQRQWELQNELEENRDATRTLDRKLRQTLEEKQRAHDKREGMKRALECEKSRRQTVENEMQRCHGEIEKLRRQMAAHMLVDETSAMVNKVLQDFNTRSLVGSYSPSKQTEDVIEAREQELYREFEQRDKERERLYQETKAQLLQEREDIRQKEMDRQAKCEELEASLLARDKARQEEYMQMREQIAVREYTFTHLHFQDIANTANVCSCPPLIGEAFVQAVETLEKESSFNWQTKLAELDKDWDSEMTKKNEEILQLKQAVIQVCVGEFGSVSASSLASH